jgi:hypothetical protein
MTAYPSARSGGIARDILWTLILITASVATIAIVAKVFGNLSWNMFGLAAGAGGFALLFAGAVLTYSRCLEGKQRRVAVSAGECFLIGAILFVLVAITRIVGMDLGETGVTREQATPSYQKLAGVVAAVLFLGGSIAALVGLFWLYLVMIDRRDAQ